MEICDVLGPDPPSSNADLLGGGSTPPSSNADLLGGGSTPPSSNADLLGGGSTPPSSNRDLLGGGSGVSLSGAPPLEAKCGCPQPPWLLKLVSSVL